MYRILIMIILILTISHSFGQKVTRAIKKGNIKKVEKWLFSDFITNDDGIEVDAEEGLNHTFLITTKDGDSIALHPLVYACALGEFEIARLIISEKNLFENYNHLISESLGASIPHNDLGFISFLLEEGAGVNTVCEACHNACPAAIALAYQYYDIFEILLDNGAKLTNPEAGYVVMYSAAGCDSLALLMDLVENHKLNVNQRTNLNGNSPVMNAFLKGQLENVEYLVSKNADLSILDFENNNILFYCTSKDAFQYAEELLKANNVDFTYPDIHIIIERDNRELFDYYVNKFPDRIYGKDYNGDNAYFSLLHIEKNTRYFYETLRKAGLKLESDRDGNSVLDYSKWMKKTVLKKLIKDNL